MAVRTRLRRLVLGALLGCVPVAAAPAAAGADERYLVLYEKERTPGNAAASVARAGGTLVADYAQIGVVVARSDDAAFGRRMGAQPGVERSTATAAYGLGAVEDDLGYGDLEAAAPPGGLPNAPAADEDTFSLFQWDMQQIRAPEAHAITGGSPAVTVGNIDTGLDKDHPDLLPNIDFARSVSCESGAPVSAPDAWDDRHGHGTHTAGTIAAASNGIGTVGVAPNVKLAAIKSSTDAAEFLPDMVVCSLMWAGSQRLDVAHNPYVVDSPTCRNDPAGRAISKAIERAVRYAVSQGVTVVAPVGAASDDLSHPGGRGRSPGLPPGQARQVSNACAALPVELPGVVGVAANGSLEQEDRDGDADFLKSVFSDYGVSAVDVTAPGGDGTFFTPESFNGRVLSTYPSELSCLRRRRDGPAVYCSLQGVSMASAHVAGVAALVVSRFGDASTPQNGKLRPGQVSAILERTADPQPCPTALPAGYSLVTQTSGAPQECQGGAGHNSWYGKGRVDALAAVTGDAANR